MRKGRKGGGEGDVLYEVRFYLKILLVIKEQLNINTYAQKCYISNFNTIETTDVFIFVGRSAHFFVDQNRTSPATSAQNKSPSTYVHVGLKIILILSPKGHYIDNKHG